MNTAGVRAGQERRDYTNSARLWPEFWGAKGYIDPFEESSYWDWRSSALQSDPEIFEIPFHQRNEGCSAGQFVFADVVGAMKHQYLCPGFLGDHLRTAR